MTNTKDKKYKSLTSSLRYPLHTLDTCLEKAKILFSKHSKNIISPEVILADLGHKSGSGSTNTILASLKYYGVLSKTESSNMPYYKIADFIIEYYVSGSINHNVLFACLNSVPINRKIFAKYDFNQLPRENEIKSFLIKKCSYNMRQANKYIEIFVKNKMFYNQHSEKNSQDNLSFKEPSHASTQTDSTSIFNGIKSDYIINYPLSNEQNITIGLPCEIRDMDLNDLEDMKDILELTLKKINKQLTTVST